MHDPDLNLYEKFLYSLISGLSNKHGYCFSGNEWFAESLGIQVRHIQNHLTSLEKKGYITRTTHCDPKNPFKKERRIFVNTDFKKSSPNAPQCTLGDAPQCTPEMHHSAPILSESNTLISKEREKSAPPPPLAPAPKEIISYKKLSLEKERLGKLIDKFGKDTVMEMCDELDNYADIYPKKFKAYACHVAVLTSWLSRKTSDGPNSLSKASNLIQRLKDKSEVASKLGIEINDVYVDFRRPGEYYRVSDKTFVQDVMHSFRKRGAPDKFLKYLESGELL